jgi:plastocyanin
MTFSPKHYFKKSINIAFAASSLVLGFPLFVQGATVNISVGNDFFSPATSSANVGDTVVWTWTSGSSDHNVVAESSTNPDSNTPTLAWLFPNTGGTSSNQGDITENSPFTFTNKFTAAGSFPYECTVHAFIGMVGTINVTAASVPPVISITSPASGTVFRFPASVTIQTSVSDSDSTVSNVQFLAGSTVLTNVTAAPFTVTTNLAVGSYTLSAIATDKLGEKATNSVNIIVDAPPTVTITNPASGLVLSAPANVAIQAIASDAGGTVTNVQFLVGTTVLANQTAAPFSTVDSGLAAGSYTLSAIASDARGITTTNTVAISVVTPLPLSAGAAQVSPTGFQFSYPANVGLTYVVQQATNLAAPNWINVATNTATSNPSMYVNSNATNIGAFYRVERVANP